MKNSKKALISIVAGTAIMAALNVSYGLQWRTTREFLEKQEIKLGVSTAYNKALNIISTNNPLERKILFYGSYKAAIDYRRTIDKLFY